MVAMVVAVAAVVVAVVTAARAAEVTRRVEAGVARERTARVVRWARGMAMEVELRPGARGLATPRGSVGFSRPARRLLEGRERRWGSATASEMSISSEARPQSAGSGGSCARRGAEPPRTQT